MGIIGDRRMVGLDDLLGPFQSCVSMTNKITLFIATQTNLN